MTVHNSSTASKQRLVAVMVMLLVFLMAARNPFDTDLWWHLRAGEEMLRSGRPLLVDTFSYTRAFVPWINHSWLSEVGMALLYRLGGFTALSVAVALLAALTMGLVYLQMRGPALWRAFLVVLAAVVIAPAWSVRPQILSLLLLAVLNGLVDSYRRGGKNRLYLLAPLFILWSNLHGGYALGLLLLAAVIGGEVFNHFLKRPGALAWRAILVLLGWTAICLLAVLVNPNGLNMWRIPFQTVGVGALQQAIPEWASPDFHDLPQQPFLWMFLALLGAAALSGRRMDAADLFKAAGFGVMALVARRNYGPFALTAAPVLADAGWTVIERLWTAPGLLGRLSSLSAGLESKPLPLGVQKAFNLILVGVLALAAFAKVGLVNHPALMDGYLRQSYPVEQVEYLKTHQPIGRVFNEYAWGGYLTWALPEYPVFVDGRTDLFGDEIIGEWLQVVAAQPGWQAILERWQVRLVLVEPGQPLAQELARSGWKLLSGSEVAVLYGR